MALLWGKKTLHFHAIANKKPPRSQVMSPLKSHFRHDALLTLETVLKQTKEAHGFA
jgi:hypothetical protein